MVEAFVLVSAAALIIAVIVVFCLVIFAPERPGPIILPTPPIRPLFPWLKELKEADPEWWEAYSGEIPSVAYREFARRKPSHPFSERVRRECAE